MKGFPQHSATFRYGIIILLLCFLVYGNSIKNGYSLDDHLVNDINPLTQKGFSGFKEIFTSYSFEEKEKGYNYEYRPILILSFAIEYKLLGTNPHTSHFISILLFAVFSFLLFYFLKIAFPDTSPLILFLAIILFIAHPIHTEVVDNIKSRDELLSGIFGISMLIHFQRFLQTKKWMKLVFVFLFFFLGFFTKDSFIVYAGIIPFMFLMRSLEEGKSPFRFFIPVLAIILSVIVYRAIKYTLVPPHEVINRATAYYENPLYFTGFFPRIPAGFSLSLFYIKLLIWPVGLSYYYGYDQIPITGWGSVLTYAGLLVYAFLIYVIYKTIRKEKLLAFGLIILLVSLFAASGILKLIPGIIGERFMFFGSAGFCIVVILLLQKLFDRMKWLEKNGNYLKIKLPAILILCLLFITPGAMAFTRNKAWENEYTLIVTDVKHVENSAKAHDMVVYQKLRRLRLHPNSPESTELLIDAEKHALRCVEIYPEYSNYLSNLGTVYFIEKRYPESEKYYLKGLEKDSTDASVMFNLATIYEAEKQPDKANLYYEKALSINPDLYNLVPFYKQFVVKNNREVEGIVFITKILSTFPQDYNLDLLLVDLYNDQHDYNSALHYLEQANKIKPSDELAKLIETLKNINNKK
jgi:tetratricopeptide (TPR) repeat protein